jgi:hypothetical protein
LEKRIANTQHGISNKEGKAKGLLVFLLAIGYSLFVPDVPRCEIGTQAHRDSLFLGTHEGCPYEDLLKHLLLCSVDNFILQTLAEVYEAIAVTGDSDD